MSDLSEYLNSKLYELDMTQADVSRASGLSTAIVAQVFSGKTKDPRISTILKICDAIGISINEIAKVIR